MAFTAEQWLGWLGQYLWAFLRVSGAFLVAPVFGAAVVPVRVKLVLALAVSVAIAPGLPAAPTPAPFSADGLLTMAAQLLIGLAIGFVAQSVFDALVLAGQLIASTMGLGFASMLDPTRGAATPVVGQFYLILGLLLYLAMDGPLVLLGTLSNSFQWLPVGPAAFDGPGLGLLAGWGSQLFAAGLLIALPAVVALLLVNIAMGVVSRAAPQLNLFAVGFPVSLLAGFAVMVLALPALEGAFGRLFVQAIALIESASGVGRG